MAKEKKSFFERLTGAINMDDENDFYDDEDYEEVEIHNEREKPRERPEHHQAVTREPQTSSWATEEEEGQLAVDVYQTSDDIIIKTMVAGVKPEDLDVSITRDMVTIKGRREGGHSTVADHDHIHKELYWGTFSRTILLPQEIEVEEAEAVEKHGLLIIRLPKIDKEKFTKLKVKTQ
jgi:HSP20 family protein